MTPPSSVHAPTTTLAARTAWWPAALALVVVSWGSQQFTPMLLLYRSAYALDTTDVQVAFAAYAFALVPGLLVGGAVSDRIGRRPVLIFGVVCSLIGGVVVASIGLTEGAGVLAALVVGRALQGVAAGAAFSAGVTWLAELSARGATATEAPRRSTIAMTTGFSLAPLTAGLLAQWAPLPATTAYLPHLVLSAVVVGVLARTPATPLPSGGGRRLITPHVRERRFVLVIIPLALWVFTSCSVGFSYLPGVIMDRLGGWGLAYTAVLSAAVGAAGVAIQPLAKRLRAPLLFVLAFALVLAGLLLAAGGAALGSPTLVMLTGLVLGAAYGAFQVAGLAEVQRLAASQHLAATTAAFQAVSYLGMSVPLWLALLGPVVSPPVLLLGLALVAAAMFLLVRFAAGQRRESPFVTGTPTVFEIEQRAMSGDGGEQHGNG